MKVKDVLNPKDLTITPTLGHHENQEYLPPAPNKIIIRGAWFVSDSNFLLISWVSTDSNYTCVGAGKQFSDRLVAKKLERLMNDNTDKFLSEILEIDLPD